MTTAGGSGRKVRRFSTCLMLVMILITVPTIGLISALDFWQVEQGLIADENLLREQTEKSIVQAITLVDAGLNLFDSTLDQRMEEGFIPFLAEYERAGRDPAAMDLSRVREELGGEMDIYIINTSGVIEYTTYPPDLGLDFAEIPYFYDRVMELRLGNIFSADRVLTEPASGKLRKYAYMPSPDHRYLFELGLDCTATGVDRYDPQYRTLKEDLMRLNPALEGIRIYDCFGRIINVTDSEGPNDPAVINPIAREIFETKQDRTLTDAAAGTTTRYILVDLSDPGYASDVSRIVELTYNTTPLNTRLAEMRLGHVVLAVFASLVACCIAFPVSRRITRPVREIADDVNRIAAGNLDHQIRISTGTEFTRLEEGIGAMVAALRENIRRLRASEEAAREYSAHLEELVRERTAELEMSNRAATLFLDIMIHDINNANTIAIGYTQLLVDALEGEQQEMARKMLSRLEQSSETIGGVATLRRARESRTALTQMDLDRVIQAQTANFPAVLIHYEGHPVAVLADDLLSEVFANLLGNAEKFGGPDVEITIRVEEHGEEVEVSVEDTGPGIPDTMKATLFSRFGKGECRLAGAGLGLYICRMLIERYSGKIWVDDRVPGEPGRGAAIRFTLRKAGTDH
ncbi:MAG: HAMP domain-containing protein [Methanoculleus bourgensis]|uniref:histidine kinase n=1 Tax=Methanoculleus bourgensis TaxID=83986 RepID=A0A8T7H0M8_9EURY|nr:HAMP domain-containing protein [Methanoculleus bourgensis]